MILDEIVKTKHKEVKEAKKKLPLAEILKRIKPLKKRHVFKKAITKKGKVCLVAEVKRKSPSKGLICKNFDPVKIAIAYAKAGASAVSVLTDKKYFGGDIKFLGEIKKKVSLPLLRKDFLIDEYQVYESVLSGADAVLLIARILTTAKLKSFIKIACDYGMDALVEVHDEKCLKKAVASGAAIIGINNRDLATFKVDMNKTAKIARKLPRGKIIVSESGIRTYDDIRRLRSLGVNAVLVGETLVRSKNIGIAVRELIG